MADRGSREISALLRTSDAALEDELRTLGEAMPEDDPEAPVPESTFTALRNLRRLYRRLARQIRAIKSSEPAKGDVLAALRSLDAGLQVFESGLRETGDAGQALLNDGAAQTETAAAELARATAELT